MLFLLDKTLKNEHTIMYLLKKMFFSVPKAYEFE